nr:MAG TPA: hypothetical protein [Caudoviricetes sp.]
MLREGDSNSPIFPYRKSSLRCTHRCIPRVKATANADKMPGSRPAFFFFFVLQVRRICNLYNGRERPKCCSSSFCFV